MCSTASTWSDETGGAAAGVSTQRFRHALIVAQLALALVLLTGTGLMLRAFWKLQQVEPGFEPKGVVTALVSLPTDVDVGESARNFWTRLRERLVTLPGVDSAALSRTSLPLLRGFGWATEIEGFTPVKGGAVPSMPTDNGLVSTIDFIHNVTPVLRELEDLARGGSLHRHTRWHRSSAGGRDQ